jgi:hypothetical protein
VPKRSLRTSAVALLALSATGLAHAQPAMIESVLGLARFAPGTTGIAAGQLAGDARDDLLMRRTALDGDFIELWQRLDNPYGGFVLGQALPSAGVRGQVVVDIDFDGDNDIAVATVDPADAVVLWVNRSGEVPADAPQFVRSAQRHAYAGAVSLAASYVSDPGAPPFRAALLLTRQGAANVVLRYDGAGGLVALPQAFAHAGGAVAMASLVGDVAGRGLDHMSFGAPPQRLWLSSASSLDYVERIVDEIDSTLVAAICTDFDADGDSDLIVATAGGALETWINQGGVQAGVGGEFVKRQTIAPATPGRIDAIELTDIDGAPSPAHADLAVSSTPTAGAASTTLYRYDSGTGLFTARTDMLPGAVALAGRGAAATGRLYLGTPSGLRVFQPRTSPLDPVLVSFDAPRVYAVVPLPTGLPLRTNLPAPGLFTVPAAPYSGTFFPGRITAEVQLPASLSLQPGFHSFTLGTPSNALATVSAPATIELYVLASLDPQTICAIECLMLGNCTVVGSGAVAKSTIPPAAFMGTAGQVQTLRDFRDGVLRDTPKGREYEGFYERFEGELYRVTLSEPTFFLELKAAKDAWMPAMESLVSGTGDALITAEMADQMDVVFDHFRSRGSRALRETIEAEYAQLDPRAFIGQPIDALRDQWETLLPAVVFESGFEGL